MGRKFTICCRRRLLHIRFLYYLIFALIILLFIRIIKTNYRSRWRLSSEGIEENEAAKKSLSTALKVDSTSKLCRKSKQVDLYELCLETNVGKIPTASVILATVESNTQMFEEELPYELDNVKIVHMLSNPAGNESFLEKLVSVLFKLPLVGNWIWFAVIRNRIEDVIDDFEDLTHYPLLKIGSLHKNQKKYTAMFIKSLIDNGDIYKFNQLFLLFHNDEEKVREWTEIIILLKTLKYQLFSVHGADNCVDSTIPCSFGTSWLRIDKEMETFDEEINPLDPNGDFAGKLHSLLKIKTSNCRRKVIVPSSIDSTSVVQSPMVSRWPVCLDDVQPPCLIYSAKIGGSELFESILARIGCDVYIFDPTLNQTGITVSKQSPVNLSNVKKFNWTLGSVNTQTISGLQHPETFVYVKASELLKKFGHETQVVDILRLDLHGGEWDVLDSIIAAGQQNNYQQLLLTVHVWHGEDKLNLLDRLIRIKKLFGASFRIFHSELLQDTPSAGEKGSSNVCCYVLGLLNTNLVS